MMTEQKLIEITIEAHVPAAVVGAIKSANMYEIEDLAEVRVLLYSGDAMQQSEHFNVYTDIKINPHLLGNFIEYFPPSEQRQDVSVWRISLKAQPELVIALCLSAADVARQYLKSTVVDSMNIFETQGDDTLLNLALQRVQDGHYAMVLVRVENAD